MVVQMQHLTNFKNLKHQQLKLAESLWSQNRVLYAVALVRLPTYLAGAVLQEHAKHVKVGGTLYEQG